MRGMYRYGLMTALAVAVAAIGLTGSLTEAGHHKSSHGDKKDKKTIVDVAAGNEQFSTLVTAVKAAGLVETLKGDGPFTVFAPTNKAFEKLPEGTLETLLEPENKKQLKQVLTYHVVPGKVMAKDVMGLSDVESESGAAVKTVQGSKATVKVSDGKVMIDGAQVTKTDIKAGNGVIHVIDRVIIPNTK